MDNNTIMHGFLRGLGWALALGLVGCGGAGGSTTSFKTGEFTGTAVEPGRATDDVQLTVFSDGKVTGVFTNLSTTSGALMGKSILSGTVNPSTHQFHVTGFYQAFMPPPPNGNATGVVNVDGTFPLGGLSVGSITIDDNGTSFAGTVQSNVAVKPQ